MTVGENIQRERKRLGISQVELGKRLEVSGAMIAQYENGNRKPKIATIRKIAKALGVDPFLLTEGDPSYPITFDLSTSDLEKISSALDIAARATYPDLRGKTVQFQPLTEIDKKLLDLGGFSALAEFTFMSEEDQEEALKDIKKFVEFTLSKYQKEKTPPQPE